MSVKLKVECTLVGHEKGWGENKIQGKVRLQAIGPHTGHPDSEENKAFFVATPSGSMEFSTINEKALDMFKPGQIYIVTIEPAEEV